jgi:hypothetical protein
VPNCRRANATRFPTSSSCHPRPALDAQTGPDVNLLTLAYEDTGETIREHTAIGSTSSRSVTLRRTSMRVCSAMEPSVVSGRMK